MKKVAKACMALAAFAAFAVLPATAMATNDPQLTESGTPLAVGAKLVGTNVGNTVFTTTEGLALNACTNALMTGEVVKNSGGTVEATITTTDFWGGGGAIASHNDLEECDSSFGDAYYTVQGDLCVRSTPTMATDEFQVDGGTCPGTERIKFIIGSTTLGACEYEATGSVKGDAKTAPESGLTTRNTSTGSGAKKIRGGFFCPSSMALKMTFALETHNGTAVLIS